MEPSRVNNYALQAERAQQYFLSYDQAALIAKWNLSYDEDYLYLQLFSRPYRLCRHTGALQRKDETGWRSGGFGEVMTALDVLCDSREDRVLAGKWKLMQNFGLLFHRKMMEQENDSLAQAIGDAPEAFCRKCLALGGEAIPGGDLAYAIPVLGELKIAIQFWFADEEFPPQVRYFWDENALQYIRYETMHYALGYLKQLLLEMRV